MLDAFYICALKWGMKTRNGTRDPKGPGSVRTLLERQTMSKTIRYLTPEHAKACISIERRRAQKKRDNLCADVSHLANKWGAKVNLQQI